MSEKKKYKSLDLENYQGKFSKSKEIRCYTKKQIRAIYPKNKRNFN